MTEKPRQRERRQFSREFKLMAIGRMRSAGNVSALADELGVRRELLYDWLEKFEAGGEGALRGTGRPRPTDPASMTAAQQIAELERKLGQQTVLNDFFEGALRRIEARRASEEPGATTSSPRSRR